MEPSKTAAERRATRAAKLEAEARLAAEVLKLRREGTTFEEIGRHFGMTRQGAHKAYLRALKSIPGMEIAEYRAEQIERLDDMLRRCYAVLERKHLVVSQGRIVRLGEPYIDEDTGRAEVADGAGEPLEDDDIVLRTVEQIRKLEADRRLLLGLNAAVKAEINSTVTTYQVELGDGDAAKAALT